MKKILSLMLSVFIIGIMTFSNVQSVHADSSDYVYIKITKKQFIKELIYCPTTNSYDCDSYMHLHMLMAEYKYYLENGRVLYLDTDEIEDLTNRGIIKGDTYRVYAYVKIKDIRIESERVYCPTTDSWNCTSIEHPHMLVCNTRYTLVNGAVYILTDEEVAEYYRTGKIKNGMFRVY